MANEPEAIARVRSLLDIDRHGNGRLSRDEAMALYRVVEVAAWAERYVTAHADSNLGGADGLVSWSGLRTAVRMMRQEVWDGDGSDG